MLWQKLVGFFAPSTKQTHQATDVKVVKNFRKRYARFRKLLDANAALAELLADLELKLSGNALFGVMYVRHVAKNAVALTLRMAKNLEAMNPVRHKGLEQAITKIDEELHTILGTEDREECLFYTLPLTTVDLSMVDWVGGKAANLGEMSSMAQVPVPRGFAVTTTAFHRFLEHNSLEEEIEKRLASVNIEDRETLTLLLDDLRAVIERSPLPEDVLNSINRSYKDIFGRENVCLAVRSSAQSEDGDKSFAGQFLTELNISKDELADSYRRVVASMFTPSAMLYRMHQGIPLTASAMAVACIEMVHAVASGVGYSHDPVDLLSASLVINGVWGLGRYAVDGIVSPDLWVFTRDDPPVLIRRRAGNKDRQLTYNNADELVDAAVPPEQQKQFCLSEEEAQTLALMIMRLERHYGGYQDVEWSRTQEGELVFLQSRPLDIRGIRGNLPKPPLLTQYPLLVDGGDIVYPGVGHGPVVCPKTPEDLAAFPQGGVLVGLHSKAEYALVMDRAQAVVTETGGVTGHMATICREFHVPTLLNVPGLMQKVKPGTQVTVDAFSGRIYEGLAEELLPLRMALDPVRLQDTPMHTILRNVAQHILPLNLVDPGSAKFAPEGCKTLHDVMRYCHELSYHEMFAISDSATDAGGVALKLKVSLPIDLHIIDLDKGTAVEPGACNVLPEEILSSPLKALLKGMMRPDTMFRKPRPVNMRGFMSVMGQQMVNPQGGDGRFGDKSYAIISDRYMNFSSRVGYHYSVLDAYCGNTLSKNYIAFSFQGGAAGEVRRERRCRAIGLVLEELGFTVTVKGDMVSSRFQKYPKEQIEDRLDQLGRLLQVTRQMDMLMVSDASVGKFKHDFMNGIYQ